MENALANFAAVVPPLPDVNSKPLRLKICPAARFEKVCVETRLTTGSPEAAPLMTPAARSLTGPGVTLVKFTVLPVAGPVAYWALDIPCVNEPSAARIPAAAAIALAPTISVLAGILEKAAASLVALVPPTPEVNVKPLRLKVCPALKGWKVTAAVSVANAIPSDFTIVGGVPAAGATRLLTFAFEVALVKVTEPLPPLLAVDQPEKVPAVNLPPLVASVIFPRPLNGVLCAKFENAFAT